MVLLVKSLTADVRDVRDAGLIPGSGRSPGEGNGNPLQSSYLENPMDRGARQATVHRVAKSWTRQKRLSRQRKQMTVSKLKDCHFLRSAGRKKK